MREWHEENIDSVDLEQFIHPTERGLCVARIVFDD